MKKRTKWRKVVGECCYHEVREQSEGFEVSKKSGLGDASARPYV